MKVLLACDMEGISGVVCWDHVNPEHAEYQRFRRIMTADVNAAVQGAVAGGATEVLIADGHWNSTNILIEELDPHARLATGSPSPLSMVQGADSGADAALFIGYHARIGTPNAVLDHTWSSTRVANLWLNDRLVGEFGLNAAVCGAFGVPVLMVTGDQSVAAEAREWIPSVHAVEVKQAAGRMAATCLPPQVAQDLIRKGAQKVVSNHLQGTRVEPLRVATPVTMRLEFMYTLMADKAAMLPGCKRLDGRTVEFTAGSMPDAYMAFRAAVTLGA